MIFYYIKYCLLIVFILFFFSSNIFSKNILPSIQYNFIEINEIECNFILPDYNILKKQWISNWTMIAISGKPQLPQTGFFLQVPENAEFHIIITDSQQKQIHLSEVSPAPKIKNNELSIPVRSYHKDMSIYKKDAYYPKSIIETSDIMKWTGNSIARILIRPFQWNPVKECLNIIEKMTFNIKFTKLKKINEKSSNSENYKLSSMDKLKSELILNYNPGYKIKNILKKTKRNNNSSKINIYVKKNGIYTLSCNDLIINNFAISENPHEKLQLWNQEKQIPIEINTQNYFLGSDDQIKFYGTELKTGYTNINVYQLKWGIDKGLRISNISETTANPSDQIVNTGLKTNIYEQNNPKTFWTGTPGSPNSDYIFWTMLTAPDSFSTTFDMPDLVSDSIPCCVTVTFQGKTNNLHKHSIYINGHFASEKKWNNSIIFQDSFYFDTSMLKTKDNELKVISSISENVLADVFYINNIQIKYPKYLKANANLVNIELNSYQTKLEIKGFTDSKIHIYDISNTFDIKKWIDTYISFSDNFYSVQFYNSSSTKLYACTDDSLLTPEIRMAYSENLKSTNNGAQYIIISPNHLYPATTALIEYYKNEKISVLTVSPDEIYDTFNGGIIHPKAINLFLKYAFQNWNILQPRYVLMVGDSNMDYFNYFQNTKQNEVPVYLSYFEDIGMSPDDNHYVCVDGDDIIPDIYIGRIPGNDITDIKKYIDKRLSYTNNYHTAQQNILFVSDDNQSNTYSDINEKGMNFFQETISQSHLKLVTNSNVNLFTKQIIDQLNQGVLILSYVGHGSIKNWGGEFFFESSDIKDILPQSPLTFYLSLNCLSGFFGLPDDYSLSEELILAEKKGAIGAFAPTGLAQVWEVDLLIQEIFSMIKSYPDLTLGELVTTAKISAYAKGIRADTLKMFTFLGDPATKLNIHTRAIPGDADSDGHVSLKDMILILRMITGQQSDVSIFPVDINYNRKIDINDILFLFNEF